MIDQTRLTLTVEEAAAALGISRSLAYELTHTGVIPHIRLGYRIVIPRLALEELLAASRNDQTI